MKAATAVEQGAASCELLERLDGTTVPKIGGTGATVVATMSTETLVGGLSAATTARSESGRKVPVSRGADR